MKIIKSVTAILIVTTICFISCKSNTAKELLVKKWKLTNISGGMTSTMPDSLKKQLIGNSALEFTSNGKYFLTGMDASIHKGNYTLNDDQITLIITPDATGKPEKNTINEISGNKLIFTDAFGTRLENIAK